MRDGWNTVSKFHGFLRKCQPWLCLFALNSHSAMAKDPLRVIAMSADMTAKEYVDYVEIKNLFSINEETENRIREQSMKIQLFWV